MILAAPDVDVRLFEQIASNYTLLSERTTLYVSAEDRPLGLSGWLHQFQRVGKAPPVTVVPNIDTIAVDEIDVSTLGHAYFADAEALLYDIFDLLRSNASFRSNVSSGIVYQCDERPNFLSSSASRILTSEASEAESRACWAWTRLCATFTMISSIGSDGTPPPDLSFSSTNLYFSCGKSYSLNKLPSI